MEWEDAKEEKFPYMIGQEAEMIVGGEWIKGRIISGYRFKYGIVTIRTDEGKTYSCGEQREDLYRPFVDKSRWQEKIQIIALHYGIRTQLQMMIEECSELIKAICKWFRNLSYRPAEGNDKERAEIINEMADVEIMIRQLTYLLSAGKELDEAIEFKLDRQIARIGREGNSECS